MEIFKPGRVYDFMRIRVWAVGLSILLTVGSALLALIIGPNYGTDFKGGTEVEIAFLKPLSAGEVRDAAHAVGFAHPDVVAVTDPSNPSRFLIRVQEVSALDESQRTKLHDALCFSPNGDLPKDRCPENLRPTEVKISPGGDRIAVRYDEKPDLAKVKTQVQSVEGVSLRSGGENPRYANPKGDKVDVALKSKGDVLVDSLRQRLGADVVPEAPLRVEWVGPKAGKQLRDGAIKSVAIAILFIMAYIAFRFDLRFAPGGVVALLHDVMVVLGVFIIFHREFSLPTIAAMLTVVGYSIADKVIVFDRIRENLAKHRGVSFTQIINISISETLSRTVITSGTVLLSVSTFFVLGTGVMKDFALALVVGVTAATYSSIFVSAPLTEYIDRRFFAQTKKRGRRTGKATSAASP